MPEINSLVASFKDGNISRKEAIRQLIAAGLTLRQTFETLGEYEAKSSPKVSIQDAALSESSKSLQALAANPAVLNDMLDLQAIEDEDRRVFAAQQMIDKWKNPDNLRAAGFNPPEGFRLSLRVFEKPGLENLGQGRTLATTQPLADAYMERAAGDWSTALTVCGSLGYIVCVSVGGDLK